MLKQQIQRLLSCQKVSSISEIVCFIIEQVNKTLSRQPLEQINCRLAELEKSKGLDVIMIEEVKTIAEALIDQREENIRFDFQRGLNDQAQTIDNIIESLNECKKSSRPSLGELDIANLLNTNNSFSNAYDQFRNKTRQSSKQNHSHCFARDNILSDCYKIKENMQIEKKELSDIKFSLLQINRNVSNKITLEQSYKIISEFQQKIYKKIHSQKLQMQKLQYEVKKDLYEEFKKMKKQFLIQHDLGSIKSDSANTCKLVQKLEKKISKQKEQIKSMSKFIKNIDSFQQKFKQEIKAQKAKFEQYCQFNNLKNEDLNRILEQLNQKLSYFSKVDQLDSKINQIISSNAKAQWSTNFKLKNEYLIWQKQNYNTLPDLLKFQNQKSQIILNEQSLYLVQFNLLQPKITHLTGFICVQSLNLQSPIKQYKVSGGSSFKSIIQIDQKSLVSIKLIGAETGGAIGSKGILKISKY